MTWYWVYIMTNFWRTVFYVGVTSDLPHRVEEHKSGLVEGFTKRYHLTRLVYVEQYPTMQEAIRREKQLKRYRRAWKENLIRKQNPNWIDLSETELMINPGIRLHDR